MKIPDLPPGIKDNERLVQLLNDRFRRVDEGFRSAQITNVFNAGTGTDDASVWLNGHRVTY